MSKVINKFIVSSVYSVSMREIANVGKFMRKEQFFPLKFIK